VRGNGVICIQSLNDVSILLLGSELLLVKTLLVVLVHIHDINVIVHVLTGALLLDGALLPGLLLVGVLESLFGRFECSFGWH